MLPTSPLNDIEVRDPSAKSAHSLSAANRSLWDQSNHIHRHGVSQHRLYHVSAWQKPLDTESSTNHNHVSRSIDTALIYWVEV